MDGEKMYRAGNAVATWLGMHGGWMDIAVMQRPENVEKFRKMLKAAT